MDIINLKFNNKIKMCIPSIDSSDNIHAKNVQDSIREKKIWSNEETSIFVDILNNNNTNKINIVDVGSNTGYFSIIGLSYNCNVIAVEANKVYRKYIEKSIEMNNFDKSKFTYYENFASNKKTDIVFDGWSGTEGLMTNNQKYIVSPISIDDICENKNILLMKIDVEGAEPEVFESCKKMIENNKIDYIIFELTYIIKNLVIREQIDILPFLKLNGYDLYEILENKLVFFSDNIKSRVNYWIKEYNTNHLVQNPNLKNLSAGTNILAVKKNKYVPNCGLFI